MRNPGLHRFFGIALMLGLGGCDKSPAAVAQEVADLAELQAVTTASYELDRELDAIEARLHNGRATVRLWSELADRHQNVTQIACENAQMHSEAIAEIERRNRARAQRLRRNRLAESNRTLASDATVTGYNHKPPRKEKRQSERSSP